MRVNFTKVLSALNAENTVIDKKLEDCQDGISRLSKLTLSTGCSARHIRLWRIPYIRVRRFSVRSGMSGKH